MTTQPYPITTQRELRRQFWAQHPDLPRHRPVRFGDQRAHLTDTRVAFVAFVDALARDGVISEALADRATL